MRAIRVPEHDDGNECDVVDQQSAAAERKRCSESLYRHAWRHGFLPGSGANLGQQSWIKNISPYKFSHGQQAVSGGRTCACYLLLPPDLANQKVQRRLAYAQFIAAVEYARLTWREAHRVVDHGTVHGSEILDEKCFAFEPDACVSSRNLRLRIES